jgi:hypothetical protein
MRGTEGLVGGKGNLKCKEAGTLGTRRGGTRRGLMGKIELRKTLNSLRRN